MSRPVKHELHVDDALVHRAARRSGADRHAIAVDEVRRLVEAAYRVVERTGSFDPTTRDILGEAGLSTQALYRHFASKDDLMLVLLEDGRGKLVDYLRHRIATAPTSADALRAWIEGLMAQVRDLAAASRTRPFLLNQDRLAEKFPEAQRASVDLLVGLLVPILESFAAQGAAPRADATAIYHMTFGMMREHAIARTRPSNGDVDHLVEFALAGARHEPNPPKTKRKARP